MKINGPISLRFFSWKKKNFLLLGDCHTNGNMCINGQELFDVMKENVKGNEYRYLFLLEANQDVPSDKKIPISEFNNRARREKSWNVAFTDVRRAGRDDKLYLFTILQSIKFCSLRCFVEHLKKQNIPQATFIVEAILYFKNYVTIFERLEYLFDEYKSLDSKEEVSINDLFGLCNFLMDLVTLHWILTTEYQGYIYYSGLSHTDNLMKMMETIEDITDLVEINSNMQNYCNGKDCYRKPRVLDMALNLTEAKCLILDESLFSNFFISINGQ